MKNRGRPLYFVANWKMNKTVAEAREYLDLLVKSLAGAPEGWEAILAPPFTALSALGSIKKNVSRIGLAGQNSHFEERGAYTGEISPTMLVEVGCRYVIIGHSERRIHFGENGPLIYKKIRGAIKAGLIPILCIGERLQEREEGKTAWVIASQLKEALEGDSLLQDRAPLMIAYEPVWAIGSGKTPRPAEAETVHRQIREFFRPFGREDLPILYGGSVTDQNIGSFMMEPDIDGALAGGASLSADTFCRMIEVGVGAKKGGK